MYRFRVFGSFVCVRMLVLRAIVYAFAVVCRRVAFDSTRVFCVCVFGLFVCACLLALRVIAYVFAFACCHVAFHVTRVCRLHVCFAFVIWVRLFAIVCLFVV